MSKTIWIDFFQVEIDKEVIPKAHFSQLLDKAFSREPNSRIIPHYEHHLRLDNVTWDENRHLCSGILHKIRSEELPTISRLDGSGERSVELNEEEGLNEDTHFVYSPRTGCVALQRNWNYGVRHTSFGRYFEILFDIKGISLTPLSRGSAEAKLGRLSRMKQYEIKVMRPDPAVESANPQNESVSRSLDILGQSRGEWIRIIVSSGKKKDSFLDTPKVRGFLRNLMRLPDAEVVKVRAAEDFDSPLQWVDLLEDRLQTDATVKRKGRELDRIDCASKLRDAYNRNREEIERLFAKPEVG